MSSRASAPRSRAAPLRRPTWLGLSLALGLGVGDALAAAATPNAAETSVASADGGAADAADASSATPDGGDAGAPVAAISNANAVAPLRDAGHAAVADDAGTAGGAAATGSAIVRAPSRTYESSVTAQRGLGIGDSPVATTVLYPRQVETLPARTSDDLLRSVAAVEMPRAGSAFEHPTAQSVSMRGVGGGRTLVLFDGVPVNDAFGGWIFWNKVPLAEVDRVDVVRGAAANVYGNLAMGGVIQLFRHPVVDDRLDAVAEYGTQDSYRVAADGTWKIDRVVSVTAFGNAMKSDGFYVVAPATRGPVDRPEPFEARNAGLRVDVHPTSGLELFVSGNYYDDARTAGTALTTNRVSIWEGALGLDYRPSEVTLWRLRAFGSDQDYHNVNSTIAPGRASEQLALINHAPARRFGGSALWSRRLGERHVLTAGADVQQSEAVNHDQVFDAQGMSEGNRIAGGQQLLVGVFSEWSFRPSSRWTLSAGLRGDYWRNYDGSTQSLSGEKGTLPARQDGTPSPRLTASWRPIDALGLRAGAYSGFRAPTLNELYRGYVSGNVTYEPNSGLSAERLIGGELGVDWTPVRALRFGVTGYVNELYDLVQSVTLTSTTSQRENIGEARSGGLEADARWQPLSFLTLIGSYALTDTAVVRSPATPGLIGKRLPNQALQRGALTVQLDLPRWLTVSARVWTESVAYADDRNAYALPAFAVVDVSVARRLFRQVELYASVNNLFDSQVVTSHTASTISVGSPLTAWVGLRMNLRGRP